MVCTRWGRAFLVLLLAFFLGTARSSASSPAMVSGESLNASPSRWVNIRLSPLGLLFGVYGAELDIRLGREWAVGVAGAFMSASQSSGRIKAYEEGFQVTHFILDGDWDHGGWFARGSAFYIPIVLSQRLSNEDYAGTLYNFVIGAIAGRQWVRENGLNFNVGAGVAYYVTDPSVTLRAPSGATRLATSNSLSGFEPILHGSIGWAF